MVRSDGDPGDEDDLTDRRVLTRAFAGYRFIVGPCRIYYAARRMPSLPEHDPGDEEPRLERLPGLLSYSDGI